MKTSIWQVLIAALALGLWLPIIASDTRVMWFWIGVGAGASIERWRK